MENYTLTMNRLDILRLSQACLHIIFDMQDETRDPNCDEYRREHVLPESVAMWRRIMEEVDRQVDAQDNTDRTM